jgi:hypothetical protein
LFQAILQARAAKAAKAFRDWHMRPGIASLSTPPAFMHFTAGYSVREIS